MSDSKFELKVSTPYGVEFEGQIQSATFKSSEGFITILKDHISIIGQLFECELMVIGSDGKERKFFVGDGTFANINNSLKMISSYCSSSEKQVKNIKKPDHHLELNEVKDDNGSYTEMTLLKD